MWKGKALSTSWTTEVINVYQALMDHMEKEPSKIIGIELNPDADSEVLVSQLLLGSMPPSLLNLNKVYLEKGVHNVKITQEVLNLYLYSVDENANNDSFISIEYQKISETKYQVTVNARRPYFLIFSSQYHPQWEAYIDGQKVSTHILVNGYANAWYINKTGSYTVTLEFWPQKLFYTGSAISVTTLILCVLYISKNKIKTIYHRYTKKRNSQSR